MTQTKPWRIEVFNPWESNEWQVLWEITDDQVTAAHELKKELNRINFPVVLRVVPASK